MRRRQKRTRREQRGEVVLHVLERILTSHARPSLESVLPRGFEGLGRWSNPAVRSAFRAIVKSAPNFALDQLEAWANDELEWLEGYELLARYYNLTGVDLGIEVDCHVIARAVRGEGARPVGQPGSNPVATREPELTVMNGKEAA
jgi:hypothetical protein